MNLTDAVQEAAQSVGDTELPVATWPSGRPQYDFNGVATSPVRPQRKLFGLLSAWRFRRAMGWLLGGRGAPVLQPAYWFNNLQGLIHSVQLVDATRRRHELEPVSGLTADGWRVTLWTVIHEVTDPLAGARAQPRKAGGAGGRPFGQMETMTHRSAPSGPLTRRPRLRAVRAAGDGGACNT